MTVKNILIQVRLDGAIIVARYVNQVQREKRNLRASRMSQGAFKMGTPGGRYSTIKDDDDQAGIPLHSRGLSTPLGHEEFNPYEEVTGPDYRAASYSGYDGMPASVDLEHEKSLDPEERPRLP
jgi:hypothetical protein